MNIDDEDRVIRVNHQALARICAQLAAQDVSGSARELRRAHALSDFADCDPALAIARQCSALTWHAIQSIASFHTQLEELAGALAVSAERLADDEAAAAKRFAGAMRPLLA